MESYYDIDKTLVNKYEAVFCVFMAVLAYLWRDNSNLIYPQILHSFLLLLVFNLAAGLSLRLWPGREWISAMFILANCGAIASILSCSGGGQSNLWVLYLLPIYTACLLLRLREVIWITAGVIGFNFVFLAFQARNFDTGAIFELLVKSAIFVFTAAVTWKIAERDRASREKLRSKRMEIKNLTDLLCAQGAHLRETERMAEIGSRGRRAAHDLNNVFTTILGFTDIAFMCGSLDPEIKEDLKSVRMAVLRGAEIVANFARLARGEYLCSAGGGDEAKNHDR